MLRDGIQLFIAPGSVIEKFVDDWRGTNDETHLLGTNVLIDASMLGSALKITSLGWKTSTAPTFPQRGHWNSVLCSRLNLDSTMLSQSGHI